jgi:glycosyltransferase involved in cell wall biosynthesis
MALAMIYPSVFEGFGIPVLEALWSGLPVITSNTSCLPETAGDAALLVDPLSVSELVTAMSRLASEPHLRELLIAKGFRHASNFTLEKCTTKVMELYKSVV